MKPNLALQARMLRLYQRFQQSNLTRAAFCREEGITTAQFTYWCRRFEQESDPTEVSQAAITLAQVSTPIQAVKEPIEREASAENQVAEPWPGFTQLHLPGSTDNFRSFWMPNSSHLYSSSNGIGLGRERMDRVLYADRSFVSQNITELKGRVPMLALSSSCRYFLYQKGTWTSDQDLIWDPLG
jgi:hypothetical protein